MVIMTCYFVFFFFLIFSNAYVMFCISFAIQFIFNFSAHFFPILFSTSIMMSIYCWKFRDRLLCVWVRVCVHVTRAFIFIDPMFAHYCFFIHFISLCVIFFMQACTLCLSQPINRLPFFLMKLFNDRNVFFFFSLKHGAQQRQKPRKKWLWNYLHFVLLI